MVPAVKGVAVEVDFGHADGGEGYLATASVPATWIGADATIVAAAAAVATADHDPGDAAVEGLTAYATNIVPGTGFDVVARAPAGSWGRYAIHVIVFG